MNKEDFNIKDEQYGTFLESIKHTDRPTNPKYKFNHLLLKLTFKLKTNINLLGVKKVEKYPFIKCVHQKHSNRCRILYYHFSNYLHSLISIKDIPHVTFLYYQNCYYLVTNVSKLTPILINLPQYHSVLFQNQTVTKEDIISILNNRSVTFNFTIVIYSSYNFLRQNYQKQISNNTIGMHNRNKIVLHLFLTPHLRTYSFSISILKNMNYYNKFSLQNNISVPHLMEGEKITHANMEKSKNEEMLSEEYCMCQHPDTQFIPSEKYKQYSRIGKIFFL